MTSKSMKATEQFRQQQGFLEGELPSWAALRIAQKGSDVSVLSSFSNILVCNVGYFAETIKMVNATFLQAVDSLSKEPLVRWQ